MPAGVLLFNRQLHGIDRVWACRSIRSHSLRRLDHRSLQVFSGTGIRSVAVVGTMIRAIVRQRTDHGRRSRYVRLLIRSLTRLTQ